MWWGLIKNSFLLLFFASCHGEKKPQLLLASSLNHLEPQLQKIDAMFMSSALIAKQVEHGAPCDAVFLADEKWFKYLADKSLVKEPMPLFKNRLVLLGKTPMKQMDFLWALQNVVKDSPIIIGDTFIPLGSYTSEALKTINFWQKNEKQFVKALSAEQAVRMFEQGATDFAILYQTDKKGFVLALIDEKLHRPIEYIFAACKNGKAKNVAIIKEQITSKAVKDFMMQKGFGL